jgi:hypothetical protein
MNASIRSSIDRRSGKDRRSTVSFARLTYHGPEKRNLIKRRSAEERRSDWVKINKWSSICLSEYKIAKFLK